MSHEHAGDRECPKCEQESLVEKGLGAWVCLICQEEFDEEFLDADIEEEWLDERDL